MDSPEELHEKLLTDLEILRTNVRESGEQFASNLMSTAMDVTTPILALTVR